MKYRKKPVTIDAVQFNGVNHDEIADFCAPHTIENDVDFRLFIPTLEGKMTVRIGDWVIRGVKGEVYSCKPDIFALTYESVPDYA